MSQTSYQIDRNAAVAGLVADASTTDEFRGSWAASEVIPAGRMCEVVAGKVRLAQGTGQDSTTLAGVSVYKAMHEPNPTAGTGEYQIGQLVPLMSKGTIWVSVAATSAVPTELLDAKYSHSSTLTVNRGMFTTEASSASAGVEISAVVGKFRGSNASATLAKVEINLP